MTTWLGRTLEAAPEDWAAPSTHECRLHQLSPYIGKLKSSIAGELVEQYTSIGDVVVDPFSGSGTIPLECVRRGRRVIAADSSPYAVVLTKAKVDPPRSADEALARLDAVEVAARSEKVDLRRVPLWVRKFFDPETLRETIAFANVCMRSDENFLLACLLGILHHQRPGFLSYPSSHLVPYLRNRLFPREEYPDLYQYRPVKPRLEKKIRRALPGGDAASGGYAQAEVLKKDIDSLRLREKVDAIITSPPYMNALDYRRDNRLRLWLIDRAELDYSPEPTDRRASFDNTIRSFGANVVERLRPGGVCVLVVGASTIRKGISGHPAERAVSVLVDANRGLAVERVVEDEIPDVRRSRRGGRATKRELIVVLRRS